MYWSQIKTKVLIPTRSPLTWMIYLGPVLIRCLWAFSSWCQEYSFSAYCTSQTCLALHTWSRGKADRWTALQHACMAREPCTHKTCRKAFPAAASRVAPTVRHHRVTRRIKFCVQSEEKEEWLYLPNFFTAFDVPMSSNCSTATIPKYPRVCLMVCFPDLL